MLSVRTIPLLDPEKCNGCEICWKVCPTLAITMVNHLPVVAEEKCTGCNNCEQRCPELAFTMELREKPRVFGVDVSTVDYEKVKDICRKARFNPEYLICYCTGTRADEVAAAILLGAQTPEDLSVMTGIRSGCTVECIQPMLRLLEAAGLTPTPPRKGYQWYGRTVTAWDIPESVKKKYSERGFYFDDDLRLLNEALKF